MNGLAPAAYGFFVMTGQAVLLRELLDLLRGNEAAVGILLFAWMAGNGIGAGAFRRRFYPGALMVAAAFALLGAVLAGRILAGALRYQAVPGFFPAFGGAAALAFPVSFLSGAGFSSLAAVPGRGVARVYLLESVGAFLGGLAYMFLAGRADSLEISFLLLVGAGLSAGIGPGARAAALAACLGALAMWLPFRADLIAGSRGLGFPGSRIMDATASRYGNLIIAQKEGLESAYYGGRIIYSSQDASSEEAVALPVLVAGSCARALAAGLPDPAKIRHLFSAGCQSVTAVFADPALGGVLRHEAGPGRVDVIFQDPYRWAARASGRFDLILATQDFPVSAAGGRYFSSGYFKNLARLAGERGVIALALDYEEDAPDPRTLRRLAAVRAALRASLPYVEFAPAGKFYFFASNAPIAAGETEISGGLKAKSRGWRLVNSGYVRHYFSETRRERFRRLLDEHGTGGSARASGMHLYRESLKEWLGRDLGDTAAVGLLFAAIAVYFAVRLRRRLAGKFSADSRSVYILAAGFAAMAAEIQFLYFFQNAGGALYYAYALLAGAFMLGLAAGSGLEVRKPTGGDVFGFSLLAWTAAVGAAFAFQPDTGAAPPYAFMLAVNFWGGAGLGGIFAREAGAAARAGEGAHAVSAKLYSFDLFGAALAAAFVPLVFIPFLGRGTSASVPFLILLAAMLATRSRRHAA